MFNIDDELKQAMRAQDKHALSVLRLLKSTLVNARIAAGRELTEDETIKILKKEAKVRTDTARTYLDNDRPELAAKEEAEREFIEKYLPEAMGEDQVAALVDQVKVELGDDFTVKNFGRIMQQTLALTAGQADGSVVARIVKQKLGE